MPAELTKDRLLSDLEGESVRLILDRRGKELEGTIIDAYKDLRDAFEEVICAHLATHGTLRSPKDMTALCSALDAAQESVLQEFAMRMAPDQLEKLGARITNIRRSVRGQLEREVGWKAQRTIDRGRLTPFGAEGFNRLLTILGERPLFTIGTDYYSAEDIRVCAWLLRYLDEIAAADFFRTVHSKRFSKNTDHVANLRPHLGDILVQGGNPLVDVPIPLLTLPSLHSLRELFFNKMRDDCFEQYYLPAPKGEGINPVLEYLARCRAEAGDPAREQFIDELIDWYVALDTETGTPSRLRTTLDENGEFPAKHQRVVMLEMKRRRRILNADPTGAGKTGAFIAGFEMLREQGKAKRALIICPTEVMPVWEKALSCSAGGCFRPDLPAEEQPKVVVIPKGNPDEKLGAWEEAKTADYVIVSNVRLRKHKKQPNYDPVALAKSIGADALCVDEAHNFRNPRGVDSRNVFEISQCESLQKGYICASTATPVYNTIEDIASLIRLLHAGTEQAKAAGLPSDINFSDINELSLAIAKNNTGIVRNLLQLRMLRRNLNHCLPVGTEFSEEQPDKVDFESPWERMHYDAIVEYPFKEGPEAVQLLTRACLHPHLDGNGPVGIGETKYQQTLANARRHLAASKTGKVLLAHTGLAEGVTRFNKTNAVTAGNADRYVAGRLREELEKEGIGVYIIDGSNTDSTPLTDDEGNLIRDIDEGYMTQTREIIKDHRDDPRKALLILLAETCGEGIAMTHCDRTFWLAPPSVKPKKIQMDGRIRRKGQMHDVYSGLLMIRGTIEEGKWEFALRKYAIIEKLIHGAALTKDEIDILQDDIHHVRSDGMLAYETLSPKQKVMHIFNRIFAAGKKRVREYFSFDGGRYAKDLARLYFEQEELSFEGNNRRLLLALLQRNLPAIKGRFGPKLKIADIACGPLGMARALQHNRTLEVHSSDICGAMLETGKQAFGDVKPRGSIKECAMDELDYAPGSMHVAFLSLALHYTKHSSNPRHALKGGDERIRALERLNAILADGGRGFIALPHSLFDLPDGGIDQKKWVDFCRILEEYGGFRVIREESGRASAAEDSGDNFASYVIALEKIAPSRLGTLPPEQWTALNLKRWQKPSNGNGNGKKKRKKEVKPPPLGAFHDRFVIGNQELSYTAPQHEEERREEHRKNKRKYQNVRARVDALIDEHGSIDAIPPEKLLSISLEDIPLEKQTERDELCRKLLEKYKGNVRKIPIRELAEISPVIFIRDKVKRGSFLCLADITDAKKHPTGGHGKRYFDEEEFKK